MSQYTDLMAAIGALLEFVGDRQEIPGDEMRGRFKELDQEVGLLVANLEIYGMLPPADKLERSCYLPDQPADFAGVTNLPGDWDDGIFLPVTFDWRESLLFLQRFAEMRSAPKKGRPGKPSKDETPGQMKIIAALKVLLNDPEHGQDTPPKGRQVADTAKVSANTVKTFMQEHWGSQKAFEAAWRRDDVRAKLVMIEYQPERHSEYHDTDEPGGRGYHRRGRTPGSSRD